ncbi:NAD(P)H-dependent oxidoreductase [Novosphingobium sp. 9U]|uniref:NAD(P)H-dependent oxidoreductase n=1 Tax=Novosphingobium sp. 9U TaxID=2653158 RepID=UPI0012F37B8B|nr:NAD(P)H-dependent oxidoreductase [Novosphingobium sp. 9U]VWX50294.1 NAD(P)H oxidoreductase YRKL / Flavodoxin 2 [Novosphingobium sp. 9U]
MRYFILFAHPEPEHSFNAAMLRHGVDRLREAGHEVVVSDLYSMNFNPLASGADFKGRRFPERLQYDREQKHAVQHDLLADDIKAEIEKLLWCDIFVMQFPLYWHTMPAIMKGWLDRVLVNTVIYGQGKRYETGGLKGRRGMVATTTGAYEAMFEPDGLLGDYNRTLWPIHNGVLFYTGLEVVPPFLAYSPVHSDQARNDETIAAYGEALLAASTATPMKFHPLTDFGPDFRMRADVEPASDGHYRR